MCVFDHFFLKKGTSMPNVGLELTTLRLRVTCFTDWASQAPRPWSFLSLIFLLMSLLMLNMLVLLSLSNCSVIWSSWEGSYPCYLWNLMTCHYAALQFSIVSSSSVGLSILHGMGQEQVPPEEVQGHFPGIGDTWSINFKLNSIWEGGLKLQILMHFMVDQPFVIGPCKRLIFIQSSSY